MHQKNIPIINSIHRETLREELNDRHSVKQKGVIIRFLSGAYGLRLSKQNDSRYPRNALSRTAHKSTEWVRKI